ncbi:hypothetical protein C8F01DRAFT_1286765 [Mycena amicta]|nr:hypothetical protein C8F01DRAFT_1286765 [Mycena amicta]
MIVPTGPKPISVRICAASKIPIASLSPPRPAGELPAPFVGAVLVAVLVAVVVGVSETAVVRVVDAATDGFGVNDERTPVVEVVPGEDPDDSNWETEDDADDEFEFESGETRCVSHECPVPRIPAHVSHPVALFVPHVPESESPEGATKEPFTCVQQNWVSSSSEPTQAIDGDEPQQEQEQGPTGCYDCIPWRRCERRAGPVSAFEPRSQGCDTAWPLTSGGVAEQARKGARAIGRAVGDALQDGAAFLGASGRRTC